jgi:hypothetical protein
MGLGSNHLASDGDFKKGLAFEARRIESDRHLGSRSCLAKFESEKWADPKPRPNDKPPTMSAALDPHPAAFQPNQ